MTGTYSGGTKVLHWAMAAMIISLLGVGMIMVDLPKGDFRASVFDIHKQLGVAVLLLALVRIVWRLRTGVPALPASVTPRMAKMAAIAHLALYGLMLAMPISGILLSQAAGRSVHLLGISLPTILDKNAALKEVFEGGHEIMAWGLALLLALHVGAALYHHRWLKDEVLVRMLPGRP
jgi:cytochrome b561